MQFGVRAANYPLLVDGEDASRLPRSLEGYRHRLFGLTSDPERLQQIRSERRPDSKYASIAQCRKEIHDAEALFRSESLMYLDSATMSVEEIASKILQERGMEVVPIGRGMLVKSGREDRPRRHIRLLCRFQ